MKFGHYRLQSKMATIVVLIVIVCTFVSSFFSLREVKKVVQERLNAYGVFLSKAFATFCVDDILSWNYPSLQTSVDRVAEYDEYILTVEVYHNDKVVAKHNKNTTEKGLIYEMPITADVLGEEKEFGYIKIVLSDKKYHAFYMQQIYSLLLLCLILGLGDTFLIYMTMRKMVLKPIKQIGEGAKIIGEGNFDHIININRNDEIGVLANTLNIMTSNLRKSKKETENYKKHLEKKVEELEKFYKLTVGRELKMIELKGKMKEVINNSGKIDNLKRNGETISSIKLKDCWDFWKCDEKTKKNCPAYKTESGKECWLVASDYCPILKSKGFRKCTECSWFKKVNQKIGNYF